VLVGNKLSDLAGYTHRIFQLVYTIRGLSSSGNKPFMVKEDLQEEESQAKGTEQGMRNWLLVWKDRCEAQRALRYRLSHDNHREFRQAIGGGCVEFTDFIKFEHCDIVSPDGQLLVSDLSFEVQPGVNVMVTGPNGCGKSSLFRVIGELWPLQSGKLSKPLREDVLFVPQKPYLALGTLRDQIIYPHTREQMQSLGVCDADLGNLLATVDPPRKIESTWKWDDVRDWFVALSGGQKQRVAMARLFYHRPKFAILDECTSAVSVEIEDAIYHLAKELGITIFTVSHRAVLQRHHDYLLQLDGRGNWNFRRIIDTESSFCSAHNENQASQAISKPLEMDSQTCNMNGKHGFSPHDSVRDFSHTNGGTEDHKHLNGHGTCCPVAPLQSDAACTCAVPTTVDGDSAADDVSAK